MEFRRSTDENFNRKIFSLKTVEVTGVHHFQTIAIGRYSLYHRTLSKIKEDRDNKIPLENRFMKEGPGDTLYLCIAAVHGDTIVLVTAKDVYAIEERDWEVWISAAEDDRETSAAGEETRSFPVDLNPRNLKGHLPEYATPLHKLTVRGTQSFDGLVVEMGMLPGGASDSDFLLLTLETFSVEELKNTLSAEAKGVSEWADWRRLYSADKVHILSIDGDEIRVSIGNKKYAFPCGEKLDIIHKCKKGASSRLLIRIYATKDGFPLYLPPRAAKRLNRKVRGRISEKNVLKLRTFEVRGIPSFHTIFIRYDLMDTVLQSGGDRPPASYPLDALKGKSPMYYGGHSGMPDIRFLAVDGNVLFVALHEFDSKGNLTTEVRRLKPGDCLKFFLDPAGPFLRFGVEIFTKEGE